MLEQLEFSLLYNTLAAIRKSRDGYTSDTFVRTSLSYENVCGILDRIHQQYNPQINETHEYAEMHDNRLDIWGYSDLTPENECDWRIVIRYDENG
jgi:hypothetical protein